MQCLHTTKANIEDAIEHQTMPRKELSILWPLAFPANYYKGASSASYSLFILTTVPQKRR
jgi:hypothetical protein